jgi:chromosome segregation ATPase
MKAIDSNRARSSQARRRVEAVITEMERTGRPLTNAAIHALADVHENWLYEHPEVKAHADRVRAQIRQDRITAAAAGQTELAEQLKTENAQLLARNKLLANQLRVVQQALAQARADEMDATMSSAELDRVGSLQDRISELEAANHKLTLERNTALIEARRLQRDLSATQDALADAERRGAASGTLGGSTTVQ